MIIFILLVEYPISSGESGESGEAAIAAPTFPKIYPKILCIYTELFFSSLLLML